MAKTSQFECRSCGGASSKWSGKCSLCQEWNTIEEIFLNSSKSSSGKILEISKVSLEDVFSKKIPSGIAEFDRVLGGGVVSDGFLFLSGDPGIGKSTLALQVALQISKEYSVLYISGEESVSQISGRVRRVSQVQISKSFSLLAANSFESILSTLEKIMPKFVVIDSIQTIHSELAAGASGSISQIRFMAEQLMRICKEKNTALLLIGHVNKEGDLAGPKVLEHLVDSVLYLEGEKYQDIRVLRAMKNRFGGTTEAGLFIMTEKGFQELQNPSEYFLKSRKKGATGSAISVTLEGARPLIIEVQALTSHTEYPYPKRTASGIDFSRFQVLIAVLKKHLHLRLDQEDVYVAIAQGFKAYDPHIDLAICASIFSSFKNIPLPEKTAFLGEIGLSGDIRPIPNQSVRLKELARLGFEQVIGNIKDIAIPGLRITFINDLQALPKCF